MKKLFLMIILGLPAFLIVSNPSSLIADSSRLAEERLRVVEIDVDYEDISLTEVLLDLTKKSGVSIVLEKKIKDEVMPDEIMISLTLTRIAAIDVLKTVAKQTGLRILFKYGICWLTTPEYYYEGRNVLRIYDVRDLTTPIRNFPGMTVRLRGNSTNDPGIDWNDDEEPITSEIELETLEEIIPEFTGNGDWSDNSGAYIEQLAGLLLIRQAPEVHYEIMRLLGQIRMNR